jgi:hypothetical protein
VRRPRSIVPLGIALVLTALLLAVLLVLLAPSASPLPRIHVVGEQLYAGRSPWRAWGMNWGIGHEQPVIAYFQDPSPARLRVLRTQLALARELGADSMRIYLQLGQVMSGPRRVDRRTLRALRRLLALATSDRVYLDITGDLLWTRSASPAWYDSLSVAARWRVQARFWRAVAHTAASSPAVLCYELTSEPIVSERPGYRFDDLHGYYFVQSIATGRGREADALARLWTAIMASAVRREDDRPVTIGLLPTTAGPFAPANVAPYLNMLVLHDYPHSGEAARQIALVERFAALHEPVLLGETEALHDNLATERRFLLGAAPHVVGVLEFFDGRGPRGRPRTIDQAIYEDSLEQFIALRRDILSGR